MRDTIAITFIVQKALSSYMKAMVSVISVTSWAIVAPEIGNYPAPERSSVNPVVDNRT